MAATKQIDRDYVMRIAALEAHYWSEIEDKALMEFCFGAMGAASNICAAILREISIDDFKKEIEQRSR